MIEIRGIYSDWIQVDKEKAKDYIKKIKNAITTNMSDEEMNKYINEKRLRGITVEELIK